MGRSENMRRIRAKNTAPEIAIRKLLRSIGYPGYRLHRKDLPGTPDIVFVGRKKAIFIHGCFWHGHDCAEGARKPKTNQEYWIPKIDRNRERDSANAERLAAAGWDALVIWECELKDVTVLEQRLSAFMKSEDAR
ncbi:MAG: very short patch repair endonuclease [Coriobacteriia bacterium]